MPRRDIGGRQYDVYCRDCAAYLGVNVMIDQHRKASNCIPYLQHRIASLEKDMDKMRALLTALRLKVRA